MRPVRATVIALVVGAVALTGCGSRHATPPAALPSAAPTTLSPTPTPSPSPSPAPAPRGPVTRPPGTAEAVATAVAFMRREVGMFGMTDPVAGPFRPTGSSTGQVDVRPSIYADTDPPRGPVTTVSLQRLRTVWYVLGTSTTAIRVTSPRPQEPISSPVGLLATASTPVHVRVTQDRYGKDLQLGSGDLAGRGDGSANLSGQVAFRDPTGPTGSVVFTVVSGHEGEVLAATVVRVRLALAGGQPPRILAVATSPRLRQQDGWLLLPATVSFQVTASRADRARLVYAPSGTEAAWTAQVVAEDATPGNGLRLVWHPVHGVLGQLTLQVLGPGGVASRDFGGVHGQ
jgi:hypothetical protein